jgi:hypothetical protein
MVLKWNSSAASITWTELTNLLLLIIYYSIALIKVALKGPFIQAAINH